MKNIKDQSPKQPERDTPELTTDQLLVKVKGMTKALAKSLPKKIEVAQLPTKSKLPFKALSIRGLLIHRASALATPALSLLEQGNVVAAAILIRALTETLAATYSLHLALERFLSTKDIAVLNDTLTRSLVGSRWPDAEHQSQNILTAIQKVNKVVPNFEASYDSLSEVAHPNWSGMLGAFGNIDHDKRVLHFGPNKRAPMLKIALNSMAGSLGLFTYYYQGMIGNLDKLTAHFAETEPWNSDRKKAKKKAP